MFQYFDFPCHVRHMVHLHRIAYKHATYAAKSVFMCEPRPLNAIKY